MGLQDGFLTGRHFVGVILHKARVLITAHHFQQAIERGRLPVAFAGKAVALRH
ncbi:hypothetical protein D3C78_1851410 [compost metagenome]